MKINKIKHHTQILWSSDCTKTAENRGSPSTLTREGQADFRHPNTCKTCTRFWKLRGSWSAWFKLVALRATLSTSWLEAVKSKEETQSFSCVTKWAIWLASKCFMLSRTDLRVSGDPSEKGLQPRYTLLSFDILTINTSTDLKSINYSRKKKIIIQLEADY